MSMEEIAKPPGTGVATVVAVAGHPLHPMLVTFPIAFLLGAFASDLAFWLLRDPFWARMSVWLIGGGAVMGAVAGLSGTVELLWIGGIRRRAAAWNHFIAAIMMLAVAFTNWYWRLDDAAAAVLPTGLALSALTAFLVAVAGWLGGHLVFEHKVAVVDEEGD